ncbi:hypothetical protein, partial [Klebsiella pneumoniae]|uniref:hypothetical protein n=1 Tax=Klebsiella pneumoniae TaxID=573 RepID=UPI0025A0ACD1
KLSGRKNKKEVVRLTISTLEGNECKALDGRSIKPFIGHIPKASQMRLGIVTNLTSPTTDYYRSVNPFMRLRSQMVNLT